MTTLTVTNNNYDYESCLLYFITFSEPKKKENINLLQDILLYLDMYIVGGTAMVYIYWYMTQYNKH